MTPVRCLLMAGVVASLTSAHAAPPALLIGSPDTLPSSVDAAGNLHEHWGAVGLTLEQPAAARVAGRRYSVAPMPTVETTTTAGPVTLVATAFRAPIWPQAADVLSARVRNNADREVTARLRVVLPDEAGIGESVVTVDRRPVVALPRDRTPLRTERAWGCTGGVVPMPGWATPKGECDPAFRSISAGMGGVPITYRFRVPAEAKRTVVLGLCESHWTEPGHRPLMLHVEGAAGVEIDPVDAWGQHEPRCLRFDASDANGDGRLEIVVAPHPDARDRNTILNVIWIFAPGVQVRTEDILQGAVSNIAEYYVDVGGDEDQLLYETAPLTYELVLAPDEEQELTFVVACQAGSVPDSVTSAWTPRSLRRAAEDVWGDWLAAGARVVLPEPHGTHWYSALAHTMMTRAQSDAYFAALPSRGGPDQFSHAGAACIIAALDLAGQHAEAERMLRAYWDNPPPKALLALAQGGDGRWRDAADDPCAHGFALQALARHALLTGDRNWADRAWPAIKAGSEWLTTADGRALGSAEARHAAAVGLLGAARVAELLGLAGAPRLKTQARELDAAAAWGPVQDAHHDGPVARAALALAQLRSALVVERGEELWLLEGFEELELGLSLLWADGLPTEFGRVSLTVQRGPRAIRLAIDLAPHVRAPKALVVRAPSLEGAMPVSVEVARKQAQLSPDGTVRLSGAPGAQEAVFSYPQNRGQSLD